MRIACIIALLISMAFLTDAQTTNKDSIESARKDSLRMAKFFSMATYPLVTKSKMSGVIPVDDIQEKPDATMKYKLLMELTLWSKDSATRKEINEGLAEAGRLINLHVAAGVPKENIEAVIVIHGGALNVLLNNDAYQKKFKTDNPNLELLKQLSSLGIKFIACGQAMAFFNFDKKDMIPEVKVALSAKTALSTYQLKHYVLYDIHNEN